MGLNLKIKGSIHSFSNGVGNHAPVSLEQLQTGIDTLSSMFGTGKFITLEFGVNIPFSGIDSLLNEKIKYKKKQATPMKTKNIVYGYKWFFAKYAIKIYDKSKQVKKQYRLDIPETPDFRSFS